MAAEIEKTDEQWCAELSPEAYAVLREGATEPAFTNDGIESADGLFRCGGCGAELFTADAKFDSGSGWPSFTEPTVAERVRTRPDNSGGRQRTEVLCATCGGHLGHVFDDGPEDRGGQRYCINAAALNAG